MMARVSAAPADAEVTGVVLAGGLGRRMSPDGNGVNKAMIAFRGRPLIEHVIGRIRPQVASVIINGDPEEPCWRPFRYPSSPTAFRIVPVHSPASTQACWQSKPHGFFAYPAIPRCCRLTW